MSAEFTAALRAAGMKKVAPNEEAKATARQLRGCLFKMIEHAIDNQWQDVADGADVVKTLADHLQRVEESYER